ncbi:MAG: hypothetical protein RL217_646 [Pseudomonadota bacterium]|jgi:SAM-dependent methyltransferase
MNLEQINFYALYRQHMQQSMRPEKSPDSWSKRAGEMQKRPLESPYTQTLLSRINLDGISSVLDVGCGNGTLSIPLAKKIEKVLALDFSPAMLAALKDNITTHNAHNISPFLRAWEDDWSDIPPCDLLLSSRSSTVKDFKVVMDKIASHALKRVVITQPVKGRFTDPEIIRALGFKEEYAPDYIYTLNLLHQQDIHPTLNYIDTYSRFAFSQNVEDFLQRIQWSFGESNSTQIQNLKNWYQSDEQRAQAGGRPMRWAVIAFDI